MSRAPRKTPGNPIRKLRLQLGWSQERLAREAGLSTAAIRKLEKGGRPLLDTALALAEVFSRALKRRILADDLAEKVPA